MSTVAYIDGQNFLYSVAERLIDTGIISDKQEVSSIDIPFLLDTVFQGSTVNIDRIKYYGIKKIKQQHDYGEEILQKSINFAQNLRKIRSCLQKTGVEYIPIGRLRVRDRDECKQCGAVDYKFQEKGVDVGMAVDIVRDVLKGKVDHVIIVSSDTDLVPAVRVAKEEGAKITYISFDNMIIRPLSVLAESTIIIRNYEIAQAYARSLKTPN